MPIDSGNLALKGLDELFSTEEKRQEEQREQVQQIPIDELHPFTNHPFKVVDDEAMTRTVESIAQFGVLAPLIARPRPDGDGYEIISGHRRQFAAKMAGLETLPVIVRDMDDDAATILMVDSNLQREHISPSERAFAYKMKMDAYRAPWKIICIRTAFKEYKTYGADLYKEALTMLAKGWEGDPDSLRSGILRGMVRFVALYQGEYDPERLVKRLRTVHPMTLVRDEKAMSGTVSYKYMMLILRTYNGSSRSRSLPIKQ